MPSKKYYGRYKSKVSPADRKRKHVDAVTWLKQHPEDIPLAKENLEMREHYNEDGLMSLMAMTCLRATADYKLASNGSIVDYVAPEVTIEECRKFFSSEMFQYFINDPEVKRIENKIVNTPDGVITNYLRSLNK